MSNLLIHPYHLVDESPWPLLSSIGGLSVTCGMVMMFNYSSFILFFNGLLLILVVMYQWWRDISYEGSFQGLHSSVVQLGLRWGMVLFIISEVFFFLSFFWAFFHSSLSPTWSLGLVWPPIGIVAFNPFHVPLLNTIILLSSGVSVTWSHHSMMEGDFYSSKMGLLMTIILGIYFTLLQGYEYYEASFSMADSVYGSTFFIATGFHGLHVIIGTIFLLVCYLRHSKYHFSMSHHFGFEAAVWYWHFVDVVWLFLFLVIYWWGGMN